MLATKKMRLLGLLGLVTAVGIATACRDDDGGDTPDPTTTSATPTADAAAPTSVPGQPRTLTVLSGTTSVAVDMVTGNTSEILTGPAYEGPATSYPYVFSPDGAAYAFPCDSATKQLDVTGADTLCIQTIATREPLVPTFDMPRAVEAPPRGISWSPDRRWIAFSDDPPGVGFTAISHVYLVNVATLKATRIIENDAQGRWGVGVWSPDSKYFAIQRTVENKPSGTSDLAVVDADSNRSSDISVTLDGALRTLGFGWSPDGTLLAVTVAHSLEPLSGALYVTTPFGGLAVRIADGAFATAPLSWSPDRRWIAATREAPAANQQAVAFAADASGEERVLSEAFLISRDPTWAPDSRRIAVWGAVESPGGLYATSIDGEPPLLVLENGAISPLPFVAWGPDSDELFFLTGSGCAQGGCLPGLLHAKDLNSTAEPRQVYDQPVQLFLGVR